ncbi:uncharacterized protein LOC108162305 [Drosophila miranda]|uniref:uncharacterized protein LOC108162305 n=1 Tax=Drosophila miranda TaxID=7229 RepID=UPI0007E881E9|nr:uncharacterized protein LOC108162305 [Drosophila miranda]
MNPISGEAKKSPSNDEFLTPLNKERVQQLETVLGEVLKEPEGTPQKEEVAVQETEDTDQKDDTGEQLNKFWIAISGYPLERAYRVYRFFNDIGPIKNRGFTQTNVMYLKYHTTVDCRIALSYDGQKIGYGGEIRVSVKPENPMALKAFLGAIEEMDEVTVATDGGPPMADAVTPTDLPASFCIDMESTIQKKEAPNQKEEQDQKEEQKLEQKLEQELEQSSEPEEVKVEPPVDVVPPKKYGFFQWLKEKLSQIFFFY